MPFFVSANDNTENIFLNGTIDMQSPKSEPSTEVTCKDYNTVVGKTSLQSSNPSQSQMWRACQPIMEPYFDSKPLAYGCEATSSSWTDDRTYSRKYNSNSYCNGSEATRNDVLTSTGVSSVSESCPPDQFPKYTSQYTTGDDSFLCYNPAQLQAYDTCNSDSGNEYLTIPVTSPKGCFTQPNGISCQYNAVDIGGGNQYYALDYEGDCYSNDEQLPQLTGTPQDTPVSDECVSFGGNVMGCPANPTDVCTSGSSYGGGSIQDCETGCGMVNEQFLCIDTDTDGDGIPDYNDPDIDGDGIANDDDLDSDGDGVDDPISGGSNAGGSGSGGGGQSIDLGPVVSELKKANQKLSTLEDSFSTDHGLTPDGLDKNDRITELNNDYKLQMENFIAKGSAELGYVDRVDFNNDGFVTLVPNDGCTAYTIRVGSIGEYSIDLCEVSARTNPILYWLFAFLTAFYIFIRVNTTLRE